MMVTKSKAGLWSKIGARATFGMVALDLGKDFDDLMIVAADTSTSAGLERFKKTYPEKIIDCGIAEQNMMGIATGLASEGNNVITTTFAPFQTMRCCEQIKVNLGYMNQNVTMVGLASGVVQGMLGYTHSCIEDLSIMRSIPGITVLSPADCTETAKAINAALEHNGPVYIRLTGGSSNPSVYKDDYDYKIGKAINLKKGDDVALIATGTMVYVCLEVANELEEQGISTAVIDMHTIKPIDSEMVKAICDYAKLVVTVEEHSVVGGLGSAVSEVKTAISNAPPHLILGLPDQYGKSNDYVKLLDEAGLSVSSIVDSVLEKYSI
ncbi:transketolase [bacterium]|jgi:transketolase|nr:transketolase [bacterium]